MQHREFAFGFGHFSLAAVVDQSGSNLEFAGSYCLVSVRCPDLGNAVNGKIERRRILWRRIFDAGARWRSCDRHYCAKKGKNERQCLGLCFSLVLHYAVRITTVDLCRDERQSCATGAGRLGRNVSELLEILVASDCDGRSWPLAPWSASQIFLAHLRDPLILLLTPVHLWN